MDYSDVTVFVNPTAGGGRTLRFLPNIKKVFESLRIQAQFVKTETLEELERSVQESILRGRNLLFAMGGDGTFHALANAAFGADVFLGILPLGGGNDFASALGIPRDPVKAAEAVLTGQSRSVDLVRVRTGDGRTRLYAGGGGIGLDAEAARYAIGAFRHLPGRFRYLASALTALVGYDPPSIRIEFPGSDLLPLERKALLAAALNSPTYGAGLRLAPQATIDDGLLDVVLIEDLSILAILILLPRLIGSGELRTSRVTRWRAQRVRLTTGRACMFHGDGEILGSTPVEIEVVPNAARVLVPACS
jgi:diacylglycerol kinase (ATP)